MRKPRGLDAWSRAAIAETAPRVSASMREANSGCSPISSRKRLICGEPWRLACGGLLAISEGAANEIRDLSCRRRYFQHLLALFIVHASSPILSALAKTNGVSATSETTTSGCGLLKITAEVSAPA